MDMETKDIAHSFSKEFFMKSRFILYLLVILCFSVQNTYGSTDITVRPYEIKFDYDDTSHDDDALTILDADGDEIDIPEWKYSPTRRNNFAYIKSQTDRKIKVKFDSNCSDMHLIINLTVTSGTGIGEICNYVIMNYEDLEEVTLTLDGSIPNNVDVRTFTWEWDIYAITNEAGYCSATSTNTSTHTYYTLLSTPQDPMDQPWSSVLDFACDWASGQTTESTVLTSLTTELYESGIEYHGSDKYTISSFTNLNLSGLLSDLNDDPGGMQMNCKDFSNFLHVLSNALGMEGEYYIILHTDSSYPNSPYTFEQFYHNYLFPAGHTSPDNGGNWNYHQVGWYNDWKVADASTKIDNDTDPTSYPFSWKLVVGDLTFSQYNDKLSEDILKCGGTGTCTVY